MMSTQDKDAAQQWATDWLDTIADGSNTMSQRKASSVEKHGGLEAIKLLAEQRGVRPLLLEDDKGDALIAASRKPFTVLC